MTETTQAIRDALAAGPTPGKWCCVDGTGNGPWRNLAIRPTVKQIDTPATLAKVEKWGARYAANATFIAACHPEAITALLSELDAAQAGIEAATFAERDRCAVLVERLTIRKRWARWARMASSGAKDIEPCALAAAIRVGGES